MKTVLVWLLLVTSDGSQNRGVATVLERFAEQSECERVKSYIPNSGNVVSRCIQARVLVKE